MTLDAAAVFPFLDYCIELSASSLRLLIEAQEPRNVAFELENAGSHPSLPFARIFLAEDGNVDAKSALISTTAADRSSCHITKLWPECHSRLLVSTSEMCLHKYQQMTEPNAQGMHSLKHERLVGIKVKTVHTLPTFLKLLSNSGEAFRFTIPMYVASAFVISSAWGITSILYYNNVSYKYVLYNHKQKNRI